MNVLQISVEANQNVPNYVKSHINLEQVQHTRVGQSSLNHQKVFPFLFSAEVLADVASDSDTLETSRSTSNKRPGSQIQYVLTSYIRLQLLLLRADTLCLYVDFSF